MTRRRTAIAFSLLLSPLPFCLSRENPSRQPGVTQFLPSLTQFIEEGMKKTHVPGLAVGVVYRDQVIYLQGFGVRTAGGTSSVTPDTIFQLASLSKPIASTVAATAVGDGWSDWDDRIAELDPAFQVSDPTIGSQLTIRDLLSHRSGLPESAGDILEELGFSRPEILFRMRQIPFTVAFRKTYEYSNLPYTEGALASIARTRQSWEDYAEKHLFVPLGMTSTSYRYSDFQKRSNKTSLHAVINGQPMPRYQRDADAEAPAGGASSNVRDMVQLLRLHLSNGRVGGDQIVPARALAETHKEQIVKGQNGTTGQPSYYGLGWDVDYDLDGSLILSHSGAFRLGAGTHLRLQPSLQLGLVVLTNAQPTGLAEATGRYFFDLVQFGAPQQDWIKLYNAAFTSMIDGADNSTTDYSKLDPAPSPSPSQPLSSYVGRYQNSYYGAIEVYLERGRLFLRLPRRSSIYPLQHWDGDLFTFRIEVESGIGVRGLHFNYEGKTQLKIDNLALEGNGVFAYTGPLN